MGLRAIEIVDLLWYDCNKTNFVPEAVSLAAFPGAAHAMTMSQLTLYAKSVCAEIEELDVFSNMVRSRWEEHFVARGTPFPDRRHALFI